MSNVTDSHLTVFVSALQILMEEHYKKNYPNLDTPTVTFEKGPKFARIVTRNPHSSAWGFVALTDVSNKKLSAKAGDIMKADGWKAPAKHARGSIFNEDPMKGCGVYGPDYLK